MQKCYTHTHVRARTHAHTSKQGYKCVGLCEQSSSMLQTHSSTSCLLSPAAASLVELSWGAGCRELTYVILWCCSTVFVHVKTLSGHLPRKETNQMICVVYLQSPKDSIHFSIVFTCFTMEGHNGAGAYLQQSWGERQDTS